jgi:hypothetical protein
MASDLCSPKNGLSLAGISVYLVVMAFMVSDIFKDEIFLKIQFFLVVAAVAMDSATAWKWKFFCKDSLWVFCKPNKIV